MLAARDKGDNEAIQVLINAGSHVNEEDKVLFLKMRDWLFTGKFQRALLVAAFEKGELEIIRTLLNAGLNVIEAEGVYCLILL